MVEGKELHTLTTRSAQYLLGYALFLFTCVAHVYGLQSLKVD